MREGDEIPFERMSEQRPGSIPGTLRLKLAKAEGEAGSAFRRCFG